MDSEYLTASIAPEDDDMVFTPEIKKSDSLGNRTSSFHDNMIRSNRVSVNMREMENKYNPFRPAQGTANGPLDQSEYNVNISDLYESQLNIIDSKRSNQAMMSCYANFEHKITSIQQGITRRHVNITEATSR